MTMVLKPNFEDHCRVASRPLSDREKLKSAVAFERASNEGVGYRYHKELLGELAYETLCSLGTVKSTSGVCENSLWAKIQLGAGLQIAGEWCVADSGSPDEVISKIERLVKESINRWCKRNKLSVVIARDMVSFVEQANELEHRGHIDTALDLIYDSVDELFRRGHFAHCDAILNQVSAEKCSLDILLALLTATSPARSKLATRAEFFKSVEQVLHNRGEYEPGLLAGLEG